MHTPCYVRLPVVSGGSDGERIHLQCRGPGFNPWIGKIPWRGAWHPTPVFLLGESPWTEEPGGLQSARSQIVGHDWPTEHTQHFLACPHGACLLLRSHNLLHAPPFLSWVTATAISPRRKLSGQHGVRPLSHHFSIKQVKGSFPEVDSFPSLVPSSPALSSCCPQYKTETAGNSGLYLSCSHLPAQFSPSTPSLWSSFTARTSHTISSLGTDSCCFST